MSTRSNVVDIRKTGRRESKTHEDIQPDLFIALPSDIPARDQQDLMALQN